MARLDPQFVSLLLVALFSVAFGEFSIVYCLMVKLMDFRYSPAEECQHRDYGHGSTVCVCTEAKCDNLVLNISKEKGIATSYSTSKQGARFQHAEHKFVKEKPTTPADHTVEVQHNEKYQKILGFGGAFTDATGINIAKLPKPLQERLLKDYFAQDGLEYRLGRIPIGGSDFSTRAYSYDDNPGGETLEKFALQPEDFNYKVCLKFKPLNLLFDHLPLN